ncbi:MAG: hypothetical protein A2096_07160 [Spirochaetes bacterium GWF1_41_5]|nr:MAG: hypothetical protein A2096_07160 [Spirochaetes bacterium GWF1_41_5]HBE04615.1 hypothetical protein [Spirochaetia bacterium]
MSIDALLTEVENLKTEYAKFQAGNKSAGTRSRKCLQTIKKMAQELRLKIQEQKTQNTQS